MRWVVSVLVLRGVVEEVVEYVRLEEWLSVWFFLSDSERVLRWRLKSVTISAGNGESEKEELFLCLGLAPSSSAARSFELTKRRALPKPSKRHGEFRFAAGLRGLVCLSSWRVKAARSDFNVLLSTRKGERRETYASERKDMCSITFDKFAKLYGNGIQLSHRTHVARKDDRIDDGANGQHSTRLHTREVQEGRKHTQTTYQNATGGELLANQSQNDLHPHLACVRFRAGNGLSRGKMSLTNKRRDKEAGDHVPTCKHVCSRRWGRNLISP